LLLQWRKILAVKMMNMEEDLFVEEDCLLQWWIWRTICCYNDECGGRYWLLQWWMWRKILKLTSSLIFRVAVSVATFGCFLFHLNFIIRLFTNSFILHNQVLLIAQTLILITS
jgi:hypothetical protein